MKNQYVKNRGKLEIQLNPGEDIEDIVKEFNKYYGYLIYENKSYRISTRGNGIYKLDFNLSQEAERKARITDEYANKIIQDLGLNNRDLEDYEKVLKTHDYIISEADYNQDYFKGRLNDDDYSAYGVLINKKGVCSSYAKAFQLMASKLNIPCLYVTGRAKGGNHGWNKIMIDGDWYNIDLTWDDPIGSNLLVNYKHFLKSDSQLVHHIEDSRFTYPKAYKEKDFLDEKNYKLKNGEIIENIYSYNDLISIINKTKEDHKDYLAIRACGNQGESEIINLIRQEGLYNGMIYIYDLGDNIYLFTEFSKLQFN